VSARDDRRADQARQRLVEFSMRAARAAREPVERRTRCGKATAAVTLSRPSSTAPTFSGVTRSQNNRFTRWFTPSRRSATATDQAARRLRELVTELERWKSSAPSVQKDGDVKRSPDVRKGVLRRAKLFRSN